MMKYGIHYFMPRDIHSSYFVQVLDRWFESSVLKATLATDACIGAAVGPDTPGGGYVLLHHVMGSLDEGGEHGMWAYPEGGMGAVSDALAASAREAGADIVTGRVAESRNETPGISLSLLRLPSRRNCCGEWGDSWCPSQRWRGLHPRWTSAEQRNTEDNISTTDG